MEADILASVKLYLWISNASKDSLFNLLIVQSIASINNLLDVDSFAVATYTEKVRCTQGKTIAVKNFPLNSVTSIDWVTDLEFDIYWRSIYLTNAVANVNWFNTVVYIAWYSTLPSDIQLLYVLYTLWLYNNRQSVGIKAYRLWEETITYWDSTEYNTIQSILQKYKKINVVW